MEAVDVSTIIVSYNTCTLTVSCLQSIVNNAPFLCSEVVVIDNASEDGSADVISRQFPGVRVLRLEENVGFARANNIAASMSRGKYILLLNPDTIVLGSAIENLLAFADAHPEASICGGRTLFPDGSLNPTSCWRRPTLWSCICRGIGLSAVFPKNKWVNPEAMPEWQRDSVREVDIVTGCFFLIRRSLWEDLCGFDPAFFMYGEEVDLCLRAAKLGHKCMICPDATIIHYGGASEKVRADKLVRLFGAKAQLFRKHWNPLRASLGILTFSAWAVTRTLAFLLLSPLGDRWKENYYVWKAVWSSRRTWQIARTVV